MAFLLHRPPVRILILLLALLALGVILAPHGNAHPLVHTVTLDQRPVDLVVDARRGHAFIATAPVNGGSSEVRTIDTTTGALVQSVAVGASPKLALDAAAGRVLVGNDVLLGAAGEMGQVSTLDARTGTRLRTVRIGSAFQGLAVDERIGRAFVASTGGMSGGVVGVVDTKSGRLVSITTVGPYPWHQLAVDQQTGRVFVLSGDLLNVLDAASGRLLQTMAMGTGRVVPTVDGHTHRAFIPNQDDATLSVLDDVSGRALTTVHAGPFPQPPVIDEQTGRVFVLTNNGISMLDARSGAVLRRIPHARTIGPVAVAVHSNRIFVANRGADTGLAGPASVSVLDARSGAVLRTVAVGVNPIAVAVDERHGHVFVLNGGPTRAVTTPTVGGSSTSYTAAGPGSVTVLDVQTGAVERTIAVGLSPVWMDVDTRTGHAIVATDRTTDRSATTAWGWVPGWLRHWLPFLPPARARMVPGSISIIGPAR